MGLLAIDTESTYTKGVRDAGSFGVIGYVNHPETEHYMVSLWCPEWSYVGPWAKAPLDRIDETTTLLSHNRSYDSAVLRRMWPLVKPGKWICTADQAAKDQMPRSLEGAARVVLDVELDKSTRDEMSGKTLASMSPEFMKRCEDYALDDARFCYELHQKLELFTELEQEASAHTTWMGHRGFRVDRELLEKSHTLLTDTLFMLQKAVPWWEEKDAKGKTIPLTSPKALNRECAKAGIPAPESTAKNNPAFDLWVEQYADKAPFVAAVAQLRSCNRLMTVVQAMEDRRRGDRVPFGLKYFGAQHTGRWSGDEGLNVQNLPKKPMFGVDVRSLIIPREGHVFVSADYSQIEARILPWIAGDKALLELLASGIDIYEAHARATMGYTDPRPLKEGNPEMRSLSKVRVLGLGFKMGAVALKNFAKTNAGMVLSDLECQQTVADYRNNNKAIVRLWGKFDGSMRTHCIQRGHTLYDMGMPSGRTIKYWDMHENGGINASKVKGMPHGWWHAGVVTENCVQGIARDILSNAVVKLHRASLPVVLHVHDEVLVEVPEALAEEGVKAVTEIMEDLPDWAAGLPLKADARILHRYTK